MTEPWTRLEAEMVVMCLAESEVDAEVEQAEDGRWAARIMGIECDATYLAARKAVALVNMQRDPGMPQCCWRHYQLVRTGATADEAFAACEHLSAKDVYEDPAKECGLP